MKALLTPRNSEKDCKLLLLKCYYMLQKNPSFFRVRAGTCFLLNMHLNCVLTSFFALNIYILNMYSVCKNKVADNPTLHTSFKPIYRI